jgi:hypothetical protein
MHLHHTMLGRWIGRGEPIAWSPKSPGLTSLDFFLWGYVKNLVWQVKNNHLQQLKGLLGEAVATVTHNVLQNKWTEVECRRGMDYAVPAGVPTLKSTAVGSKQKKSSSVLSFVILKTAHLYNKDSEI